MRNRHPHERTKHVGFTFSTRADLAVCFEFSVFRQSTLASSFVSVFDGPSMSRNCGRMGVDCQNCFGGVFVLWDNLHEVSFTNDF